MKRTRPIDKRQHAVIGDLYNMINILQKTDSPSVASFDDLALKQIDLVRQLIVDTKKDY